MSAETAMQNRVALLLARDKEHTEPPYEGKETVMACYDLLLTINKSQLRRMHVDLSQPHECEVTGYIVPAASQTAHERKVEELRQRK